MTSISSKLRALILRADRRGSLADCSDPNGQKRGFSLIEVMIAGGMLAVLATGSMHLLTSSGSATTDLIVRQKAVFALNAEMERLTGIYQWSDFADTGEHWSTFFPNLPYKMGLPIFSWERYIYPNSINPYAGDEFVTTDVAGFRNEDKDQLVLFVENGLADRNYVWIDQERNIAAEFSFWVQSISATGCQFAQCECKEFDDGPNGDRCLRLEMLFDYPYALNDSDAMEASGDLKTLTLRSIVGRQDG